MSDAIASDRARVLAVGVGAFAASQLATRLLAQSPMAALLVQAIIAETAMGRLGVAWSDPALDPAHARVAARAARGAALGLGAGAALALFSWMAGAATLARSAPLAIAVLLGLVTAAIGAAAHELFLRGLVLRAFVRADGDTFKLFACASVAAAYASSAGPVHPIAVVSAAALAVASAALWLFDGGAWLPWSARTAWLWTTETLLRGHGAELTSREGWWGGGNDGPLGGAAGALFAVLLAAAAVVLLGRARRAQRRA